MRPICLDSSAWIEISHNGENAHLFLKAAANVSQLIVSTITIYEVWKYTVTRADETRAQHFADLLQQGIIVPLTAEISISAATLSVNHKLAMADSIIYATSLAHKATLWTQDADFDGLPHVKYFPKIKKP